MGKLIVIEGVDASGKATQTEKIYTRLKEEGYNVRQISFPDYDSDFSVPVKRYLAGDLGRNADDVSPYAASTFYAIDRYASFKRDWGAFYNEGGILIADRYVTSNLVHQAAKIKGDKTAFMNWLYDLEYDKLELPKPDLVLFLDMPPACARKLMANRANKITGGEQKDIHERDPQHLDKAYNNAMEIAELAGWEKIACAYGENIRTIDDISDEIYKKVKMTIEHSRD